MQIKDRMTYGLIKSFQQVGAAEALSPAVYEACRHELRVDEHLANRFF